MKVVEVNVGKKIEYSVSKNKITFADELMLNCEKLERDNDECVCLLYTSPSPRDTR